MAGGTRGSETPGAVSKSALGCIGSQLSMFCGCVREKVKYLILPTITGTVKLAHILALFERTSL